MQSGIYLVRTRYKTFGAQFLRTNGITRKNVGKSSLVTNGFYRRHGMPLVSTRVHYSRSMIFSPARQTFFGDLELLDFILGCANNANGEPECYFAIRYVKDGPTLLWVYICPPFGSLPFFLSLSLFLRNFFGLCGVM